MVKYWLLISLILINIVGQASLDDQSTICQISIRAIHTLTQRILDANRALLYATGGVLFSPINAPGHGPFLTVKKNLVGYS